MCALSSETYQNIKIQTHILRTQSYENEGKEFLLKWFKIIIISLGCTLKWTKVNKVPQSLRCFMKFGQRVQCLASGLLGFSPSHSVRPSEPARPNPWALVGLAPKPRNIY